MEQKNLNEIKKALYRENVKAELMDIIKSGSNYKATLKDGHEILFFVPHADLGYSSFYAEMPAKHLIRYIIN